MAGKNKNIDDLFRDSLADFEASPDESAWDVISERLAGKRKSRILPAFLWMAAGIAMMAIIGVALYMVFGDRHSDIIKTVGRGVIAESPSIILPERVPEVSVAQSETVTAAVDLNSASESQLQKHSLTEIYESQSETMMVNQDRDQKIEDIISSDQQVNQQDETSVTASENENYADTDNEKAIPEIQNEIITVAEGLSADLAIMPDENKGKWILGGELAPVYTYRHIYSGYLDEKTIDIYNSAESGMMAYAGGVSISYVVTGRVEVMSGLQYSKYGQVNDNAFSMNYMEISTSLNSGFERNIPANSTGEISKSLTGGSEVYFDNTNAVPSYDNHDPFTLKQIFEYLEVPLVLKYKLVNRKLDLNINGGIVTNLMIGNRVYISNNGDEQYFGKTEKIRELNYLGLVGLGVEYPVSGRLGFSLEPRFRYYINSFDKSGRINVHPYAFGIYTGLRYSF